MLEVNVKSMACTNSIKKVVKKLKGMKNFSPFSVYKGTFLKKGEDGKVFFNQKKKNNLKPFNEEIFLLVGNV